MQEVSSVEVKIWNQTVGAVAPLRGKPGIYEFQYAPSFARTGIELSPLAMPVGANKRYSFQGLAQETYHGLPGLLADALPDKFGNALIDEYLSRHGMKHGDITTLQRLLYVGRRAIGAIEFEPATTDRADQSVAAPLQMSHLVEGARRALRGEFMDVAQDIIDVGSSAGGARAKAVVGWKPGFNEVVSGQFDLPDGFEHWLLKFDVGDSGILGYSAGYGRIEFAHHLMAVEAGITMNPCHLLEENGRAHFMTKRFDREGNNKLHLQSLCGLEHLDFNIPYVHGYERYFRTVLNMKLGAEAMQQAWMRCAFNVVAVNCDDHTKNLGFLLNEKKEWALAPAYDVCFSHNPAKDKWTRQHQMLVNGKGWDITKEDLLDLASKFSVKQPKAALDRIIDAVARWPEFAKEVGVAAKDITMISAYQKAQKLEKSSVHPSAQIGMDANKISALKVQALANCQKNNLPLAMADMSRSSPLSGVVVAVDDKWVAIEEDTKVSLHEIANLNITSTIGKLRGVDLLVLGNPVKLIYRPGKDVTQTRGNMVVDERRASKEYQTEIAKGNGVLR